MFLPLIMIGFPICVDTPSVVIPVMLLLLLALLVVAAILWYKKRMRGSVYKPFQSVEKDNSGLDHLLVRLLFDYLLHCSVGQGSLTFLIQLF